MKKLWSPIVGFVQSATNVQSATVLKNTHQNLNFCLVFFLNTTRTYLFINWSICTYWMRNILHHVCFFKTVADCTPVADCTNPIIGLPIFVKLSKNTLVFALIIFSTLPELKYMTIKWFCKAFLFFFKGCRGLYRFLEKR